MMKGIFEGLLRRYDEVNLFRNDDVVSRVDEAGG